ncbi:MAG: hypothetical protein CMJ83_18005 [Planctomycetes bacterium]|nr:hypothetical protein [Planctomycetota bacterium]
MTTLTTAPNRTRTPRVVIVARPTEYTDLLLRLGTRAQAEFWLASREQSLDVVEERHQNMEDARDRVRRALPREWRRAEVDRDDLDRFLFGPDDVVVCLGQDGLVANTAKYLDGQPVIGLNPDPALYEGVLALHEPEAITDLLLDVARDRAVVEERTMVVARLDDGQRLLALNELFIGHRSHQSARYRIAFGGTHERHSSSGLIVATGTGATGWARSIDGQRATAGRLVPPRPTDARLAFYVREPWPSVATGTSITEGLIGGGAWLKLVSEQNHGGVVFGDGIEDDRLPFDWGRRLEIGCAEERLRLVVS